MGTAEYKIDELAIEKVEDVIQLVVYVYYTVPNDNITCSEVFYMNLN